MHAHPDDETLSTGALLAVFAAAGRPVTVVTCTRGELGEVIGPELAHLEGDGPALAAYREIELTAALAALGVTDHAYLDQLPPRTQGGARFSDSGMAWAGVGRAGLVADLPDNAFVAVPLDDAAGRLAGLLRERRPEVVVTYEPGGGYGHPDHVRAHTVTMRALELAGDPGVAIGGRPSHVPAAVLWAVVPDDVLRSAYRSLAVLPVVSALLAERPELAVPEAAGPLPTRAVPAAEIDVVVDVVAVLPRLVSALAAHRTQVQAIVVVAGATSGVVAGATSGVVGAYALSNDLLAPLLDREYYRRAPAGASAAASAGGQVGGAGPRDANWPPDVRPVP